MTDTAAPAVSPRFEDVDALRAVALDNANAFVRATGLDVHSATGIEVVAHIDLTSDHHTPWGIVHGGVYASAIEATASIGATLAVSDRGMVAVGLTNTTNFMRSLTEGRVDVIGVPVHQGRSQQLWKVDVTDERGRLIAHGEVRLQNLDVPS